MKKRSLVNPGPDLCSLRPGSITLRKCQGSSPQKGTVGHPLLSGAQGPEQGQCDLSASVGLWDSTVPLPMGCKGEANGQFSQEWGQTTTAQA